MKKMCKEKKVFLSIFSRLFTMPCKYVYRWLTPLIVRDLIRWRNMNNENEDDILCAFAAAYIHKHTMKYTKITLHLSSRDTHN